MLEQGSPRSRRRGEPAPGLRDHNERLVMSMIQRHGSMPGVEIARRAGLSQQTVSVILRRLETGRVLAARRSDPRPGRQAVDPDGAGSRRGAVGRAEDRPAQRRSGARATFWAGSAPSGTSPTATRPRPGCSASCATGWRLCRRRWGGPASGADRRDRHRGAVRALELARGAGRAAPAMAAWRDLDFAAGSPASPICRSMSRTTPPPAARAEHVFGRGRALTDYACFFVGSFIGGGVVLNHTVYTGQTGNAGAFGTLPVTVRRRAPATDRRRLAPSARSAAGGRRDRRRRPCGRGRRTGPGSRPTLDALDRRHRAGAGAGGGLGRLGDRLRGGADRRRLPVRRCAARLVGGGARRRCPGSTAAASGCRRSMRA